MSNTLSDENSLNVKPSALKPKSSLPKSTDVNSSNLMNLPDAKWIQVFINGDEHFPGCRCVVNSRYYRNLDMFLNYLTERLKPSFGAVRNIYTPVNGHPIRRLEDLISKQRYVVAGNERFKKLEIGYSDAIESKIKRNTLKSKNKFKVTKAKPVCHNSLVVYVYQNGMFKANPHKINLLPQDTKSWETVFQKICDSLKCAPIKRLYSLNGKPVQRVEELSNNQFYVIVEKHEIFKTGHYGASLQKKLTSSKEKHFQRSSKKSSPISSAKSSTVFSHNSAMNSRQSSHSFQFRFKSTEKSTQALENLAHNTLNITELGNGVDSDSFNPSENYIKEQENNIKNKFAEKLLLDYDYDSSGIFHSKSKNFLTDGALEIEDSTETKIDLPIDLLDAEEVEEDLTPDMERSLQQLSLEVPDEIVAYLPTVQNKKSSDQDNTNKYNITHSQNFDIHNIYV